MPEFTGFNAKLYIGKDSQYKEPPFTEPPFTGYPNRKPYWDAMSRLVEIKEGASLEEIYGPYVKSPMTIGGLYKADFQTIVDSEIELDRLKQQKIRESSLRVAGWNFCERRFNLGFLREWMKGELHIILPSNLFIKSIFPLGGQFFIISKEGLQIPLVPQPTSMYELFMYEENPIVV